MKIVLAAWLLASAMVHGLDAPALKIDLLTGESLAITRISKVEPDGVTVWTESGVQKIPVLKLAGSELARFSLSEEKARIYAAAVAKQEAAYYAQLERELLTNPPPGQASPTGVHHRRPGQKPLDQEPCPAPHSRAGLPE